MPSEEACNASPATGTCAVAKGLRTLGGLKASGVPGHRTGIQPREE